MKFTPLLRLACASLLALAIAGCGSGGSDPEPVATPQVAIRATAQAVNTDTTGSLQTSVGATVSLDGSASVAGSGTLDSYAWTVESRPTTSRAALVDATSARASFAPDVAGTYTLRLRVADSNGGKASSLLTLTVGSAPAVPSVVTAVSFSGPSTTLAPLGSVVGAPVTLDATGSTDPAGGTLTLTWTVLEKPAGSSASLVIAGARATLTPDLVGNYRVQVRAQTAAGNYADAVQTYVVTDEAPRVLVSSAVTASGAAGRTITAAVGNVVELTGTDTFGGQSGITEPLWALVSSPFFSNSALAPNTAPQVARFVPDTGGDYVVQFSARDRSTGVRSFYSVTVRVSAGPTVLVGASVTPVASVTGPTFVAQTGVALTLRGTGSNDPAGGALSYGWRLTEVPAGSTAGLATPNAVTTAFTPDRVGSYKITLTVTNTSGLSATRDLTLLVGATLPTARVERASVSVLLGSPASVSATASSSESGNALTYSWAIDARPAGSTAMIAAPTSAVLSFTPDVAGTYTATVTVSDGPLTAVAPVTIVALSASAGVVPLNYTPVASRYSKATGKLLIAASDPPALHVVDPADGSDLSIPLPAVARALSVSPSGRYAAVLYDNTASLVDLIGNRVVQSFFNGGTRNDIVALDTGAVVLAGQVSGTSCCSPYGFVLVNGTTGVATQTLVANGLFDSFRVVYANAGNRLIAVSNCCGTTTPTVIGVDPVTSALTQLSTSFASVNGNSGPLWLSEDQAWLFNSGTTFYRTTDFGLLGTLIPTPSSGSAPRILSFSHSTSAAEAVALEQLPSVSCCDGTLRYPPVFKRWVGALLFPASDLALPRVDGDQAYGFAIFHAADNRKVVVAQTGSATPGALGLRYYVLLR